MVKEADEEEEEPGLGSEPASRTSRLLCGVQPVVTDDLTLLLSAEQ